LRGKEERDGHEPCFPVVMPSVRTLPRERRRDPRFALPGTARLAVREPAATVEGALLDVSAAGLRVRTTDVGPLEVGTLVDVEVSVRDSSDPSRAPLIHLRGHGAVVRRVTVGRQAGELAVRLDGPLGFREYFSQVRVF
jgi:hypothetical protein